MNSIEADRVLTVLNEALDGLRTLSYITPELLESADQLDDELGQDICDVLLEHSDNALAQPPVNDAVLLSSTKAVLRAFKNEPAAAIALRSLQVQRSTPMLQAINYFEKLCEHIHKRLTTTVEEDTSNREYYEEVKERDEKAAAEKLQLEHKLKLQRVERQIQLSSAQTHENKASSELDEVKILAVRHREALDKDAGRTRDADHQGHATVRERLVAELAAAEAELEQLQQSNHDNEVLLRKAKKRAQHDVEAVIGTYDGEMEERERQLQVKQQEYRELQQQMEKYAQETEQMRRERVAYDERQRLLAEAKRKETFRCIRLEAAVYVIQNAWKLARRKRLDAAKKDKKKGGKGGKEGKGKK